MDPEQLNASLLWFAVSTGLALTLSIALYFSFRLFGMDPDAAAGQAFVYGLVAITPGSFLLTFPYALSLSRAYMDFLEKCGEFLTRRRKTGE